MKSSLFLLFCLFLGTSIAQVNSPDANGHAWWQHAVFYEIYPRSFADSNNDGVGDLNGITAKLDYLKSLGIDAIWITPCFPSPQVDFGYDVSDFQAIDPQYGTLTDFDRLVSEGKKRGIRIILDFVMNHTSNKHKWFVESRSSRKNPKRNWYVWRDGKAPGGAPNNWTSTFGGSAWQLDATTNQYYYHYFYREQPDLNWRNPAVEQAMFDVTRWWYHRGVSGFRLDAVDTLFEDPDLRDNPVLAGRNKYGDPNEDEIYDKRLPEVHEVLTGLRKVADQYSAVLIGETWTKDMAELRKYYGEHNDELQMPMDFLFAEVNELSPTKFRTQIQAVDSAGGWPVFVFSNHDIVRHYNRYGDGAHNDQITKLLAALYLTLRGTPILYYGEEIGMENNTPKRKEDVKDPIGIVGWPTEKGRDGERTPMQWNDTRNAGFSTATPWVPVAPNYTTHNVALEDKDPNSILNWYRALLKMRHANTALLEGNWTPINENDQNVLAYLRQYKGETVLVALNMTSREQRVQLGLPSPSGAHTQWGRLMTSSDGVRLEANELFLEPFGVYIGTAIESAGGAPKRTD